MRLEEGASRGSSGDFGTQILTEVLHALTFLLGLRLGELKWPLVFMAAEVHLLLLLGKHLLKLL